MSVQKYDPKKQALEQPYSYKVKKILACGCLKRMHSDFWQCLPIKGYNVTTYDLKRGLNGRFSCTCQGYYKRGSCSHLQALDLKLQDQCKQQQGVLF